MIANAEHRRRAAGRPGHARPLPDHRHRRPRHDVERDRRRPARADRAPRPARRCCRTEPELIDHAADEIIRYVSPVKHFMPHVPGAVHAARRHVRARRPAATCRTRRRTATRRCSPTRSASTSRRENAAEPPRLRVRAPLLPRRPPRPHGDPRASSGSCSAGSTTSSSPATRRGPRRTSWRARRASRSRTGCADDGVAPEHPLRLATCRLLRSLSHPLSAPQHSGLAGLRESRRVAVTPLTERGSAVLCGSLRRFGARHGVAFCAKSAAR